METLTRRDDVNMLLHRKSKESVLLFRPINHPLLTVDTCPQCKGNAVSLPSYPGDYFDCEDCGHSWPCTKEQLAKMRHEGEQV